MGNRGISVLGMALGETVRNIVRHFTHPALAARITPLKIPERLVIAPKDLRTADSALSHDIYSGRFFLAGTMVDTAGGDPFIYQNAPLEWHHALHSFSWLRHIDGENTPLAKMNAVALINDWCSHRFSRKDEIVWRDDIAALRLIAWLCHSVLVVEAMTPRQYQNWIKAIAQHIRFLKIRAISGRKSLSRLYVKIALAYAAICTQGLERYLSSSAQMLDEELDLQISPDGMHHSRNPAIHVELLLLLLPLRQAHASRSSKPSQNLITAIDRLMLSVKCLRLGDGNLVRFNGTTYPRSEFVSTVLQYDDSPGNVSSSGSIGGYYRFSAGQSVLIADLGYPPYGYDSQRAHAGTLSFEFSCENTPILVNCGAPPQPVSPEVAHISRTTSAHNTVTIDDTSSSAIYQGKFFTSLLKGLIVKRPTAIEVQRNIESDSIGFSASHNGYARQFGVVHHRKLQMSLDGNTIIASDGFKNPAGGEIDARNKRRFAIRFHLHPAVSAGTSENGNIILMCGGGITWQFAAVGAKPVIEESVYFASVSGAKRTSQIVLYGDVASMSEVIWQLSRNTMSK